jgi:hypothetical protein
VTKPSKKLSRDVVHNDEGTYEWWISVENARIFLTTEKLGRVFLYNPVSKRREMSIDEFRYGTYQHYYHEVAAEVQRQLDELGMKAGAVMTTKFVGYRGIEVDERHDGRDRRR